MRETIIAAVTAESKSNRMQQAKTKGEVINTLTPWKIFPLFLESERDRKPYELPHYDASQLSPLASLAPLDKDLSSRAYRGLHMLLRRSGGTEDFPTVVLTAAIQFVSRDRAFKSILKTKGTAKHGNNDKDCLQNQKEEEEELCCEGWTWVQDIISWDDWTQLYRLIYDNLCIISIQHPLEAYANQVVPHLPHQELYAAVKILGMESKFFSNGIDNHDSSKISALRLSQLLKEAHLPRQYGVLFSVQNTDHQFTPDFRHCCLPTAALEIEAPTKVNVVRLYEKTRSSGEDCVGICTLPLDGGSMEKEAKLRCRRENEPCILCRYERKAKKSSSTLLPWQDAVRLGHHYFQQERYHDAETLYKLAISRNEALADVRHALGALQLAQNKFLKAQIIWKEAAEAMKALGREPGNHPGIALQLEKQQAYHYLEKSSSGSEENQYHYRSCFSNTCFITPMLDKSTCQRLIDIGITCGIWTTDRHYAVPTNDKPIHKVPELLDWFYPWMERECAPLLTKQFGTRADYRFYVHDAFFVRYEGSKTTNHLPCHCDECSHSFVVCLNDDFDGGGTYFHDFNVTLSPKTGDVVSFKGDTLRHGGDAVIKGSRYIIAAFCYLDLIPSKYSDSGSSGEHNSCSTTTTNKIQSIFHEAKKQKIDDLPFSFDFAVNN